MRRTERASSRTLDAQDALSLDDLDKVVGGSSEGQNREGQYVEGPAHEGGYQPPVVHAPADLPAPIQQIETQVSNHSITGDQAVTQIADIIGHQPDHGMQGMAGAEIASLIGRGLIDETSAMTDLHNAVTQAHSLTGEQAVGVLAGMMAAQSITSGESASISTAAHGEISALVSSGQLDADHAITVIAGIAGNATGGFTLVNEMHTIATDHGVSAASLAHDISAAVDTHDLTGTQAVSLLINTTSTFGGLDLMHAAGHEIADLVAHHGVSVADAMAGVTSMTYSGESVIIPILSAAAAENHDLLPAAGAEIALMLQRDPWFWSTAESQFNAQVSNGTLTPDLAVTMLLGCAAGDPANYINGNTSWSSQMAVDLIEQRHVATSDVMTDIQNSVTAGASADAAVNLLYGIATNGGYGASLAPSADATLVQMLNAGQVDVAHAATMIGQLVAPSASSDFYAIQGLQVLLSVGTSTAPGAESAVTAALQNMLASGSFDGARLVNLMGGLVGANSAGGVNAAFDAIVMREVTDLIASGAIGADTAITALADAGAGSFRIFGRPAIAAEIEAIAAAANFSPAHVVADVLAGNAVNSDAWGVMGMLSFLSGASPAYQAAAVPGLLSLVDGYHFYDGSGITSGLGTLVLYEGLPVDTAVSLMAALVSDGTTAVHADTAAGQIASFITAGKIGPAQAMADIHASVVSGVLGGDAALTMLANIAASSTTARIAVNNELVALVNGTPPLVPAGHAGDVLTALQTAATTAGNTALIGVITSELSVLAASDPAEAVFQALSTISSDVDLDGAATSLATLMQSGATSIATVMHDIDHAFATGALTAPQAATLLADIAVHGNLAAQVAAGAEFAAIVGVAGTAIQNVPGTANFALYQEVLGVIGVAMGGTVYGTMPTAHASTLTTEGAFAFLAGALSAHGNSDANRQSFETALFSMWGGSFQSSTVYFPTGQEPLTHISLVPTFDAMLAAHVMPGADLIHTVILASSLLPPNYLPNLIVNQSLSMADVHGAITAGYWAVDAAVKVLASLSSIPAVMAEIDTLLAAGTISAGQLIADSRDSSVADPEYIRILDKFATSSDVNTQHLVSAELVNEIIHGPRSAGVVQAILSDAGARSADLVDQMLGQLGAVSVSDAGHLLGGMVAANITTFDHVIAMFADQSGPLVNAVEWALIQNDLSADQVTAAFMAAASTGPLSGAQAKAMAVAMADLGYGQISTTAGAMLAAAVSSGRLDAVSALDALVLAENAYAHFSPGSVGINVSSMTATLTSFLTHCDPSSSGAAVSEIMALVSYNFYQPYQALSLLMTAAGNADAGSLHRIGGALEGMMVNNQQSFSMVSASIGSALGGGMPGLNAVGLYTNIAQAAAAGSASEIMTAALDQIGALVPGHVTAAAAVAALNNLMNTASTMISSAAFAVLSPAIGAEINAIADANPDANVLSGIDDAIRAGTMTGPQAASMLAGMLHGPTFSTGVATEIHSLLASNLMTPWQMTSALAAIGAEQSHPAGDTVAVLANLIAVDPALAGAAVTQIQMMITAGQISPHDALYAINGTINHPLSVDQVVEVMTGLCSPNAPATTAAVAADLTQILSVGGSIMTLGQIVAGIDHAVTGGVASADNAVTLLARLAPLSDEAGAAAAQEIVGLIAGNRIGAANAMSYVGLALSGAPDHGINLLIDIAANSNAACQLAFGSFIAGLVGDGTVTADQAVGFVRDAYTAQLHYPVHAPFALGFVTAQQELELLANMLAGMASAGHRDATSLIAPVHAELLAAMHTPPYRATDTQVVAALQEAGLSGGPILAATNEEIARLEADPKVLIDVAAQTGLDMGAVGSQLATLIAQGTVPLGEAFADILAATNLHNLTNDQALTMVVSTVAHAAGAGIYLQATGGVYANNWLLATASTLEHLAQNGLSPDSIGAALHSVIGQGQGLLSPGDAVAVLASTAAYPDMQGMAAAQLAGILNTPNFYETPNQLAYDVSRFVSDPTVPGGLRADAGVQLLVRVAATIDTSATYGGIALGLGQQASPPHITPDDVANAVTALVQTHALGGEQALHFLAPCGVNGPGTIGHAIGSLIAANEVSMADFTTLIAGGVLQDSNQIQNTSYWQQIAGTGNITFDTAVVMLAAMTSQTDLAVTQLAQIAAADTSFVGSTIANRVTDAGMHPDVTGLDPREAVRVLTILASDHSAPLTSGSNFLGTLTDDINRVVGAATAPGTPAQYYMTYGDAVAEVARLSVNSNAGIAQAGMAVLNVLVGQTGMYGNDGIVGAVGHGLTAEQAVTILVDLSVSPTIAMQQHVRADISYLIDHGQITPAQAFAGVHAESLARGIGASQELSIYAGVVGSYTGVNAAVESAAADSILAMVSAGRLSLGQALDGLAQATVTSAYITNAQSQDIYLRGGLSIGNSATLMATIAAHSADPGAFGVAAAELAAMVTGYPAADRPAVTGGIDAAVSSGLLTPQQAVVLLASAPLGASDDARAAFGGEFTALIANGAVTVDQAVSAIEGMAHNGTATQQLQAGAAIALLVSQNQLTAADAIGGVTAALANNALTPDQAVGVLAGLSAGGPAALSTAAAAEMLTLINGGGDTGAHALSLLLGAAVTGSGSMLSGVSVAIDALVEGHAVTATDAMQSINTAWGSGAMPTPAATALLVDMGRTSDAALQVAVGHEVGAIIQACNAPNAAIATLGSQLAANVTQDQAVVLLAGAIAGAGTTTQTPLAALIVAMINNGPIDVTQVLADIDAAAASHALPAAQALVALAHLEEAIPNASRMAVVNEATALVSNGLVPATDAAQTLLGAAHGGSTALQSLIGGMLASLADHSLLTGQQVVAAIMGATTISNTEALGVLMGMGVNGNAAAQEVSGAGILSMIQNGRIDAQAVVDLIDYQSTHNGISPEHGLQVLLNVAGAAVGELNAGAAGLTAGYDRIVRDQMIAEVVHLVQTAQFYGGGAHNVLVLAAGHSVALAEVVGRCCAFLGTNAAIIGGSELAGAVRGGAMTADEAMMVALASSMSLQPQGQYTFISFVQSSGLPIDQAIHFLAVTATRTGDADADGYRAYSRGDATDYDMMNAAFADMVALVHGIPGVAPVATSAAVFADIVATVGSHDLSAMQASTMLAVLGGRLGGADVVAAAGSIGSLVTQHLISNGDAWGSISAAVTAGLDNDAAKTMYAAMALSADPSVRQIAMWHFSSTNLGAETLAHALHDVTTNALFTHDQALTILCNVAPGILDGYRFTPDVVAATLAAEITTMVASHQITADHALAMLAGFASGGDFNLDALGAEVAALVTAGAVTLDRALGDLGQGGLNVDQVVTVLGRMSALDQAWDTQIVSRISTMVGAGQITAAQAMADLGALHDRNVQGPRGDGSFSQGFALHLLPAFVNASPALEAAAATEYAALIGHRTLDSYNLVNYALAHFDQVHAYGWMVSVAAYGNSDVQSYVDTQLGRAFAGRPADLTNVLTSFVTLGCAPAIQYYIGQELGRLVDRTPAPQAPAVIDALDLRIAGTKLYNDEVKDLAQGAKNMHISVDTLMPTKLSSDAAAMVLLGMSSSTHNADVAARTSADQTLVGRSVDAQFITNVAQALPPEQALTQFANMAQNGWASTALVAKGVADMVAAGTVTVTQVIAAMGNMDTNHALALVTDILALHEAGSSAFSSQFATLTLLTWGVAPTSPTYTQMHDAITQAVPDFVGLVRGTTTAQQAMTDIRAIASANNVAVDALLLATYQAAAQDPAIGAASLTGALTTIGHEIYTHLTDGTAAHAIANMVVGGSMSESAAATLMQELSACATIPPNAIMSQVTNGNMSVWYADAHYPGWSSTTSELQFTATQAVAMMHVDVHVAQDVAAVLAGTMTAQAAIDDVLAAGSQSDYAKDLGLVGLAHELAGASQVTQDTIGLALTARVASGATESTLVTMASHGWVSAQGAVDTLREEIRLASAGVEPQAAAMFEAMALARLDLAASGQGDPNATLAQQQAHAHDTSSAIQSLLEGSEAVRVLQGLGALQTLGNDNYMHGASLALAQHMMGVVVTQLTAQEAANPGSTGSSSSTPDWAHSLPPAVQQTMHYADIATQIFTFGIGGAALLNAFGDKYAPIAGIVNIAEHPVTTLVGLGPSLLELAVAKYAPATDIAALTRNPASVQTWVDLGVDVSVGGIPGAGALGLPSWAGGIQANLLNEALGEGASSTFLVANIGSKAALAALEMGVVKGWLDDHPAVGFIADTLKGELGLVSESCSLISGMISGAIHTGANMYLAAGTATFETFKDIFTGHNASDDAAQLGKTIFVLMTGASLDSVATVGEDVGNAMVDIFTGHPQNLSGDLSALGKDSLHMIASNPFLQMASQQAYTYLQRVDDYLGNPSHAYTSDGLKQFLGLPTSVSWDDMMSNTFSHVGNVIADGVTDLGNTIGDGFKHAFHI